METTTKSRATIKRNIIDVVHLLVATEEGLRLTTVRWETDPRRRQWMIRATVHLPQTAVVLHPLQKMHPEHLIETTNIRTSRSKRTMH
ncbi:hypothetical protein AD935_14495 [Gluconobacter japonicus]|nr:hypothetical protein AD935_14495 [Gluconobacter japonicus]